LLCDKNDLSTLDLVKIRNTIYLQIPKFDKGKRLAVADIQVERINFEMVQTFKNKRIGY
jgi:hypothetical protein